jgi:SAM-dependent methyltransferase
MANANVDRDWEGKYQARETRWDSGRASRELRRVLAEQQIEPCRAIDLGCGTGTNAVHLATLGFAVTGVDCAPRALELARGKGDAAEVRVEWIEADVQHFGAGLEPFDLVFDRGCYHCCRRVDLEGYRETLMNVMRPGSRLLLLCGNANEQSEVGPPRVTEQEIRDELGGLIDFEFIREFRFEDAGGVDGPLGWSCFGARRLGSE